METKTLTREEIALSILNGIVGFRIFGKGRRGALDSFSYSETDEKRRPKKMATESARRLFNWLTCSSRSGTRPSQQLLASART